jgi:cysteine desulfuration protein SufE
MKNWFKICEYILLFLCLALLQRAFCYKSSFGFKLRDLSCAGSCNLFRLPNPLLEQVELLRNAPNDQLRYQQLLFWAKCCQSIPEILKVEQNKVPGCVSSVYIHAQKDSAGKVYFVGDSDAQLTKGLLFLLITGLSNQTAEDIIAVDPAFIGYAGISASLTPGRNSGFLNIIQLMKRQASRL